MVGELQASPYRGTCGRSCPDFRDGCSWRPSGEKCHLIDAEEHVHVKPFPPHPLLATINEVQKTWRLPSSPGEASKPGWQLEKASKTSKILSCAKWEARVPPHGSRTSSARLLELPHVKNYGWWEKARIQKRMGRKAWQKARQEVKNKAGTRENSNA